MTDAKRIAVETVWVPGHTGWQGQRRSTTGLIALGVLLAAVILFYARHPAARAEIGAATLARLRSGDF
ncbi:hypothetical protein [Microbacterium sp. Leaf159]|uniref:hypothetical protein n=1 Tax=Microbacterium sp. Leaf159 TaxID=1736279 RepID=UPI000700D5D0|nr:hypothetical protein [Microbacterium sp. Leaf159]KQR39518.1 hypothetical protein ASF80_08955 [Microbacterium sp. Leaf159]